MPDKPTIFLSVDEAVEAVGNDFLQYPSQFNLFTVLWPLVFGHDAYLIRDPEGPGVWLKTSEAKQLRKVSIDDIGVWIVRRLKQVNFSADRLARICTLVFQTPSVAGPGPMTDSPPGIWVQSGMERLVCRQCGHCCRTLEYHDGCSLSDYRRWQKLGRTDVLEWVGTVKQAGVVTACQIWMEPGTNRYAEECPWLMKSETPGRFTCTIHDVRPTICRQYPGSCKHARMTGCRGI